MFQMTKNPLSSCIVMKYVYNKKKTEKICWKYKKKRKKKLSLENLKNKFSFQIEKHFGDAALKRENDQNNINFSSLFLLY